MGARPDALLLDFGGVIFQTTKRPEGYGELATHLSEVLGRAGHRWSPETLEPVLRGGVKALKDWKNASSRRLAPLELDHRTIWHDFLASPLPLAAREVLAGSAGTLLARLTATLSEHTVRPGIPELLATAAELGVTVGIVSNAHSGRAHRTLLAAHGLDEAFGVQVYSDEVGLRKPHPGIIAMAARALGTTPERTWYVGDTLDRDVVAGRRAGVGAVILTRHHSDVPPYPVTDTADAVLDTPEGIADLLRASTRPAGTPDAAPGAAAEAAADALAGRPSALLLDHGGVVVTSVPDDAARLAFGRHLSQRLAVAGYALSPEEAVEAVAGARVRHRAWKDRHEGAPAAGTPADPAAGLVEDVEEIDATTFWVELVGPALAHLGDGIEDWLRAEAYALILEYARSKSLPTLRPGVRDVLEAARAGGVPVAIVSNTVCGRAVREELEAFGIDHLVGVHVYSDELGYRKPDPVTARTALTALGADPRSAWFVGDKPHRDVLAARGAGVGTVVLVRGGSSSDATLDSADGTLRPDHVIAEVGDLLALWSPASRPSPTPPRRHDG
ncbi:HAD-IA family hydrolase [Oerskovia sp. Sa2CUA9]|uniref:HAD-IA family hydrolase n=1 Tax=Oerskovia merdavium TaxID=2762227 RepID=A0ABR8TUY5_9CELL|nr:HAD-IA family hydrolase [Oerskovia merdavium]